MIKKIKTKRKMEYKKMIKNYLVLKAAVVKAKFVQQVDKAVIQGEKRLTRIS